MARIPRYGCSERASIWFFNNPHYLTTSQMARAGALGNGAPELADMRLDGAALADPAAFLRSINEDYE